ncbi:hypothetical protein AB4Z46_19455 [Variovorax sp. M-6]|uniref:hypothetical protein n=1 Tax=Variovorax sp. M-6 TaxID=3233041 RepID=UPI003F9E1C7E
MPPIRTRTIFLVAACAVLGAAALLPLAAQGAESPPAKPHAAKAPAHDSKVLGGIERGADATGRGIARGADATRRGVDHTAERASAPVRRWGEALGRKITPHAGSKPAAPAVGPQGNSP